MDGLHNKSNQCLSVYCMSIESRQRWIFCMFGYVLQLHWSLSLSDHFIVALEDATLIQMNAIMSGTNITIQGRRKDVLNTIKVYIQQHTSYCHLVIFSYYCRWNSVIVHFVCVSVDNGKCRGILDLEAGQWSLCLQYGSLMSYRWVSGTGRQLYVHKLWKKYSEMKDFWL